eukprot:364668-Chlamydomonas_euryale.AAC.4
MASLATPVMGPAGEEEKLDMVNKYTAFLFSMVRTELSTAAGMARAGDQPAAHAEGGTGLRGSGP